MNNREIDRLVATKVMGWEIKVTTNGETEFYDNGSFCGGKWVEDVGPLDKDNLDVFKPSTKIQDAWLVITIINKQYEMGSCHKGHYCHFIEWVKTSEDSSKQVYYHAEAETAPMAICLAALKAVGVEIES